MKKLILPIMLVISNFAIAKDNISNSEIKLKNSLLWKITGNEITQPSYLYGTMHLICDKTTFEKDKVQKAVDKTSQLYLEVDMFNPEAMQSAMNILLEDQKIKDINDQTKKAQLLSLASKHLGMSSSMIENTTLMTIFSMMAYKATDGCAVPTSVEEALIGMFKEINPKVFGLETIEQQMKFVTDSGVANLDNTITGLEEFSEMKVIYKEMNEYYQSENISALYTIMIKPSDVYSQEFIDKMMEVLLVQRNKNWVEQIPEIASQSQTFFGVGAGHLPGKNGVINLLRQAGYTVEAVMD